MPVSSASGVTNGLLPDLDDYDDVDLFTLSGPLELKNLLLNCIFDEGGFLENHAILRVNKALLLKGWLMKIKQD